MAPFPDGQQPLALTDFQVQVAQPFFSLPEAAGFLLAGGAGLVAQHLTTRPTHDLDFFTRVGGTGVPAARDALEVAAHDRGWTIERVRDEATFCRLIVRGEEALLVDLALDSPPEHPVTASPIGPTFAPEELAGRKVVALFDRAEARDFADYSNSLSTTPRTPFSHRPSRSIGVSTASYSPTCSAAWAASSTRICPPPKHAPHR